MVELSIKNNEAEFKKKILEFDEKFITGLYRDLGFSFPEQSNSIEYLADFLILNLKAKNRIVDFCDILKYFEFYSEIESFSKEHLIAILPLKLRKDIKSKSSREDSLRYLTKLVLEGSINIEQLDRKTRIYSVVSKIKKINKKDELACLANGLWDNVEENIGKDQILKRVTTELEFGNYSPEKVEEILNRNKDSQKKAKVENTNVLIGKIKLLEDRFLSIEKLLKKQDQQISDINHSLKKISDNIDSNQDKTLSILESFKRMSNLGNAENLLLALRKESLNLISLEQGSFDSIKESLKKTDVSDIILLRDGLSIIVIDYLMKMTKEIDWEVSLDLFYRILSEEVSGIIKGSMSTIVEIPQVRDKVCKRMGIKAEKFDHLLLKCFDIQWVNLEVGTPIGEIDVSWLDTGKNRFYYVKLLRK